MQHKRKVVGRKDTDERLLISIKSSSMVFFPLLLFIFLLILLHLIRLQMTIILYYSDDGYSMMSQLNAKVDQRGSHFQTLMKTCRCKFPHNPTQFFI